MEKTNLSIVVRSNIIPMFYVDPNVGH